MFGDVLGVFGLALLVAAAALVAVPLALAVAGGSCLFVSWLQARR